MFRKTALFAFIILFTINLFSQDVISSQGDSYTDSSASIDFTIGEVVTFTGSTIENNITQGFHQTNWNFVSVQDHVQDYQAIIYPNPTEDFLNIQTSLYQDVNYLLYDEMGKLILQGNLSSEKTSLDVSKIATGRYSLTLINSKEALKTFNIIKTR
jgi:hypothetical protein|tara:strand:- start:454 stop:921 length:468 start_codon:yes stop_codon:yes gene_type:complete